MGITRSPCTLMPSTSPCGSGKKYKRCCRTRL
ncbi:MAG: SEC-C metal-binding domain-containing protein [Terriglobales bacterium]